MRVHSTSEKPLRWERKPGLERPPITGSREGLVG